MHRVLTKFITKLVFMDKITKAQHRIFMFKFEFSFVSDIFDLGSVENAQNVCRFVPDAFGIISATNSLFDCT
jgi:hypothetical protein